MIMSSTYGLIAEAVIDNVIRKQNFTRDHPEWNIWCRNYHWYAENGDQKLDDSDLGFLINRLEALISGSGETGA